MSHVKSVIKAFLILEELDLGGELSLAELSSRLSMDKATVYRLLNTIKEAGYINRNEETKKYSNSLKLQAMGNRVEEQVSIKNIAKPYLDYLSDETNETVNLGIYKDGRVVYIDKVESRSKIKVDLGVGTSIPAYCSALGKAVLSQMNMIRVESIIDQIHFEKFTESTIDNKPDFKRELLKAREDGYAVDNEEYMEGLMCFASAILDFHGNPIAAISLALPCYRYDEIRDLKKYSDAVMKIAGKISAQIGYSPSTIKNN